MKWSALIFLLTFVTAASARLGDSESQLVKRYGKPISVRPGGRYDPYFDKFMDFEKEGIAISCGIHDGKCVTIEYKRDRGFNSLEFEGFKGLNHSSSGVVVQRSATSLKFISKKDYQAILDASQTGIRRMRQQSEALERSNRN
jgi:hypothetical protein